MSEKFDKNQLHGKWVRVKETNDEIVYQSYENAPLSRGPQRVIEFLPDGKLIAGKSAADDRLEETQGEWQIEDDKISFTGTETKLDGELQIDSIKNDKLTLKKRS